MRIRYGTSKSGERVEIARIYTAEEHLITRDRIDPDAVKITRRLTSSGHQAYIVGGAVRDLLIGNQPKDFDIATDAHPRRMRSLFRNARVIGRRFRLVHVNFGGKIIEVSTFRSRDGQNSFGTIDEDVRRRDFTMNALYYSPEREEIVDYVGGYPDMLERRIRPLVPLDITFEEDPVRMIRAAKYTAATGFELPQKVRSKIKKSASGLDSCPPSRMTEEILKILSSGSSSKIVSLARQLGIFPYMLIEINRRLERSRSQVQPFLASLSALDSELAEAAEGVPRPRLIEALVEPFFEIPTGERSDRTELYRELFAGVKALISPITPPNNDVHEAVKILMGKHGIAPPPKPKRRRRRAPRDKK